MKFAVCAILKNENLYLREWVEHYINLGFDKIILYDNNDINGEIPQIVIQDYIDKNIVDLYDFKNVCDSKRIIKKQLYVYNECLKKYKSTIDWILCVDIDEFLILQKHNKIAHVFEENNKYLSFNCIIINWKCIVCNDSLYYENKPVTERFTEHKNFIISNLHSDNIVKSFVNTKKIDKIYGIHIAYLDEYYDTNGIQYYAPKGWDKVELEYYPIASSNSLYNVMYINHYYTKSLIEYLYRIFYNGWTKNNSFIINDKLKFYKQLNGWTDEHEKVYQNFLKQNNIKL